MKTILVFGSIIFLNFGISQSYCAGDNISISHQNSVHIVGAGIEGYEDGSEFRLSDYNGELNGGNYYVTFIDMSASW